jgi:hypothetical protein
MALSFIGAFTLDDSAAKEKVFKADRNWTTHPAVVEVDNAKDIFAVGDAHADPKRLLGVLTSAKIIERVPKKSNDIQWSAGESVLVITGDMIDKGKDKENDALRVIALLRALRNDAASKGGQVIITMGNHEAEFLANPYKKKTKEFYHELKKAGQNPTKVANCDGELGEFLCNLPIAVRVNDWFFSHAGYTDNRTIAQIASDIENGFAKRHFRTEQLVGDQSILEARLGGSPWFGTYPKTQLAQYAASLGVKHIVQGHQPGPVDFGDGIKRKKGDLFERYGLLFLIDAGMSRGVGWNKRFKWSTGGTLHISGSNPDTVVAICANGQTATLWDSETNQDHAAIHCKKRSIAGTPVWSEP